MHLLREGQFSVASQFLTDALKHTAPPYQIASEPSQEDLHEAVGLDSVRSEALRRQFAHMYHILQELREHHNLLPAIAWARSSSEALEKRGSNLEFELGQLQFVNLFTSPEDPSSQFSSHHLALRFAREELTHFQARYLKEIQKLACAMAFQSNLAASPYRHTFLNEDTWEYLATSFTREFCSLLGLSAESPLYIAATAGAIALPTLLKLQTIMKEKRTEWTTQQELPVRLPRHSLTPSLPITSASKPRP